MEGNKEQTNHPWSTLSTIATFDRDKNPPSTICESDNNRNPADRQRITYSTIVIETLIRRLCAWLESDRTRRNNLYFAMLTKLNELDILDNTYNNIEFKSIRERCYDVFSQFISVARATTETDRFLHVPRNPMPESSRYQQEFIEISFIAKGGFGKVFKARNCLDDTEYAIKKIQVHSNGVETINEHLEEVKTWARLEHINIVSYKAAWTETTSMQSFIPTTTQNVPSRNRLTRNSRTLQNTKRTIPCKYRQTFPTKRNIHWQSTLRKNKASGTTGHGIIENINIFEYNDETSSSIVSFRNTENDEIVDPNENNDNTSILSSASYADIANSQELRLSRYSSFNMNQHYVTLYIQMTLCEQTLQEWMCNRINATPVPLVIAVLEQLLCGIDYLHSENVVHHDIKPSNIFISTSKQLRIQLGDFGLACLSQRDSHNSGIGTHMYAAPEQLQGKCDPKSDIYSLGIVLTELLILIRTRMELVSIINCLKRDGIPKNLTADRHKWVLQIKQLIQEDPSTRPSAKQLLNNLKKDKDTIITELRNNVHDKDSTIHELQKKVALLEEKIKNLEMPSGNV